MPKFIAIPTLAIFLLVATPLWINTAPAQAAQESEFQTVRFEGVQARQTASIERINLLLERATSLITKFEDRGLDMTGARTAVTETATAIEQAKEAINKFKNGIPTITTKNLQESIRKTAAEANQAIKKAHAKVVEVIRLIRASYDHPTARTATTTP